jgi:hypothetical protein
MIRLSPALEGASEAEARTIHAAYVLITPARNEAHYIANTIKSVIAQTVRPARWVIVSDGSTDETDDIVMEFSRVHHWILLCRMPEHRDRQFAAKAHCFNAGFAALGDHHYEYIANLDADITFGPDYFAFILRQFAAMPRLGVAGTPFIEDATRPDKHSYAHGAANLQHVSGACQVFRRECFASIGGYQPVKGGAIDWIAVTTARMMGWETRTFTEKVCLHHRSLGTGTHHALIVPFHYGRKAQYVGGHPAWALLRGIFEMRHRPWIIGGLLFQLGFFWGMVMRTRPVVTKELMAFHRGEQMQRLKAMWPLPRRRAALATVAE